MKDFADMAKPSAVVPVPVDSDPGAVESTSLGALPASQPQAKHPRKHRATAATSPTRPSAPKSKKAKKGGKAGKGKNAGALSAKDSTARGMIHVDDMVRQHPRAQRGVFVPQKSATKPAKARRALAGPSPTSLLAGPNADTPPLDARAPNTLPPPKQRGNRRAQAAAQHVLLVPVPVLANPADVPPQPSNMETGFDARVLDAVYSFVQEALPVQAAVGDGSTLSHAQRLLARGRDKVVQKFGEESVECVIEAIQGHVESTAMESADVLYHLVLLWIDVGIDPQVVWNELGRRLMAGYVARTSGLQPLLDGTTKIP